VRGHHRQSLLHASMEGVAYPLTHTTVEGGKAASVRAARLHPPWVSRASQTTLAALCRAVCSLVSASKAVCITPEAVAALARSFSKPAPNK
jgi:hypothetical protein